MTTITKVFPVIHHLTDNLALEQAKIAYEAGADGVFLISHHGKDMVLPSLGEAIKNTYPTMKVGLNFLGHDIMTTADMAREYNLDMIWGDSVGVSSSGLTNEGKTLSQWAKENPQIEIFGAVAFKYQPTDKNPPLAASNAHNAGFIPTTSGSGTGQAPTVEKIASMADATDGVLAIASGMTLENVLDFTPYLSHILVATGVSIDDHHFDVELLNQFISKVKEGK
jgi:predicted TIM-barrel enzyme